MISFDLKCQCGYVFEAWFRSSADYDDQRQRGLVACPVCNGTSIGKAVMAPNVSAKGNSRRDLPATLTSSDNSGDSSQPASPVINAAAMPALPPEAAAMLMAIAKAQAEALPQSRWVGRRFAEEARALHRAGQDDGDGPPQPIHGQATREEAEALAEEGIAVMPLLVPVVPPEQRN